MSGLPSCGEDALRARGGAAIEFRGAGFSYAGARGACVREVNLSIREGECVVVTGPSGCGKTTLARMVNGLIPAVYAGEAFGEVRVLGRSVAEWEMDGLSCAVGSVFQNPRSQFFNLDTTSEVAFGCENMGVPRDEMRVRIARTVHELEIEHLMDRDIRALSGGEKQLVALASVHAMEPSVFVLDEPTAALDVGAMLRLREAVARLKAAGKTVFVAEHRLWWLAGVADRIVLMEDGCVTADLPAGSFAALTDAERSRRGLRAWDIGSVRPARDAPCAPAAEGGAAPRGRAADGRCASAGAPPSGGVLLEARGLAVRYGRRGRPVVQGCDFAARAGCAVALVGRNGAGKTTLARCLAGLRGECAGAVMVGGERLSARGRAGRVYLAMQESGYQLFSDTVEGELGLALEARARRERPPLPPSEVAALIDGSLAEFGLEGLRGRHPLSLSGGQRQRLALAAGALQGADVMVLDEPTSGLDLANMHRVAAAIARLKKAGACLVVITHDFEFACATCDEAAYLEDGRIVERLEFSQAHLARIRELFGFR